MARPSQIDRLPDEIKTLIGTLRQQGRTIDEIREALAALSVEIPRATLGRHTAELDRLAQELRESAGFATALAHVVQEGGETAGTARMTQQLSHAVLFKFMRALAQREATELDAKEIQFVMGAMEKLTKAEATTTALRERLVKEAAAKAETEAAACGLSADMVGRIKSSILGIAG